MSDEVTQQAAEAQADRNVARQHYDWMMRDRDGWQRRAEAEERAKQQLADALQTSQQWISEANGKTNVLTAERDVAERERTESRAEVVRLRAECDGLRADLLAHPPEVHQELVAERKRHLELMEDYDRQNVMIGTLEEALKRTENLLKVAVDDRLKGVLASISKLSNEAEEMLS